MAAGAAAGAAAGIGRITAAGLATVAVQEAAQFWNLVVGAGQIATQLTGKVG